MSKVNDLLAELYSEASSEGNQEVIDSISHLMPLDRVLRTVTKNTDLNENWEKLIVREKYSNDELRGLFSEDFLNNPRSVEIIEKVMVKANHEAKTSIAVNLLSSGMTDSLLRTRESWSPDLVKEHLDHPGFSIKNAETFSIRVPHPGKWNRSTIQVFEILDIDMPDDYDPHNFHWRAKHNNHWWTPTRMNACDAWVGEIVDEIGVPTVTMNNGDPLIINSALALAFLNQQDVVAGKGQWHKDNFPTHLPVLATPAEAALLQEYGAIEITPIFEETFASKTLPHHGFQAAGGETSDHEVTKSLSLLSLETVEKVRLPSSDKVIVLIPAQILPSISMELRSVPKELLTAIRYHRPDYLYSMINDRTPTFRLDDCTSVHPDIYCRGLPMQYTQHGSLYQSLEIMPQLLSKPFLLDILNSPEEIAYTKNWIKESDGYNIDHRMMVHISELDGLSLEEQVSGYKNRLKKAAEKVGEIPALYFSGSLGFLKECARQRCYTGMKSTVRWANNNLTASERYKFQRVRAQLGCLPMNSKAKPSMTLNELLSTGVRSKDDSDIPAICGMIDRYSLDEVGQAAKTEAQVKFLLRHYDAEPLLPHVNNKIKTKIEKALARERIEADLGL